MILIYIYTHKIKNQKPFDLSLDPGTIPNERTAATKFNYIKLP